MRRGLLALAPLALLGGCATAVLTPAGQSVTLVDSFTVFAPDPFAAKCELVASEANGEKRPMFGPIEARNYAATIGANSLYWLSWGSEGIKGTLHDCQTVFSPNYASSDLRRWEVSCQNEFGATYRIATFRATLKYYRCPESPK